MFSTYFASCLILYRGRDVKMHDLCLLNNMRENMVREMLLRL